MGHNPDGTTPVNAVLNSPKFVPVVTGNNEVAETAHRKISMELLQATILLSSSPEQIHPRVPVILPQATSRGLARGNGERELTRITAPLPRRPDADVGDFCAGKQPEK